MIVYLSKVDWKKCGNLEWPPATNMLHWWWVASFFCSAKLRYAGTLNAIWDGGSTARSYWIYTTYTLSQTAPTSRAPLEQCQKIMFIWIVIYLQWVAGSLTAHCSAESWDSVELLRRELGCTALATRLKFDLRFCLGSGRRECIILKCPAWIDAFSHWLHLSNLSPPLCIFECLGCWALATR